MDGLGISFAGPTTPESSPAASPSPSPLSYLPNVLATRKERSATRASDDSFMEGMLSEFDDWKKNVTKELEKNIAQKEWPEDAVSEPSPKKELAKDIARSEHRQALREKARQLAAQAAATTPPDIKEHPAFQPQNIRIRGKRNQTRTDLPKCWRPKDPGDDKMRECCEQNDGICEDCGFILCPTCDSRCRGEDWCVVSGCVRCQSRLGVNLCTPHLRELRAKIKPREYPSIQYKLEPATHIVQQVSTVIW